MTIWMTKPYSSFFFFFFKCLFRPSRKLQMRIQFRHQRSANKNHNKMRQRQLIWYETIYDNIKLLSLSFSFKLIVTFSMFITFNMPRDNVSASNKFAFTQNFWCLRKFDTRIHVDEVQTENATRLTRLCVIEILANDNRSNRNLWATWPYWSLGSGFWSDFGKDFCELLQSRWLWHTDSLMAVLLIGVKSRKLHSATFLQKCAFSLCLGMSYGYVSVSWIRFEFEQICQFLWQICSFFYCGLVTDLENVYHVTRRKWFYFVKKAKNYTSAKESYVKYLLWKNCQSTHKTCKSAETNCDTLNSNSNIGAGAPLPSLVPLLLFTLSLFVPVTGSPIVSTSSAVAPIGMKLYEPSV